MPAATGAAARAEALRDLLGDLAAGQVGREQAGGGDGAGGAGAVSDDHGPGQAQQDGSPVALRVQPGGEFAQAAALQERADPRHPGAGHRGPQLGRGEPDRALERFQRDVSGEAVGHDHVELASEQVTALHVARERQRERAVRRIGGQQLVRPPGELVPLAGFGADGEQPDPRRGDPERDLRVGHAELAELDEHLRFRVGGGPGVDEHRPARPGGQDHGEPGPQHPGQRPQPEPRGRDQAAGRAGRHDGGRVAAPDQLAGHGRAGPRAAQAGQRSLVHGQVILGRHDAELFGPGVRAQLGQRLPQAGGGSGQQDPDAVLAPGRERAGHDLVGRVIAAHGVDGEHRAGRSAVGAGHAGSALGWPLPGTVRCRAQRVTQRGPGRQGASSVVSFAVGAWVVRPIMAHRAPAPPARHPGQRGGRTAAHAR